MTGRIHVHAAATPSGAGHVLRVACAALILSAAVGWYLVDRIRAAGAAETPQEVARRMREILLAGAHDPYRPGAGMIGSWDVQAQRYDEAADLFHDFRLEVDGSVVVASTARLVVDPISTSMFFELTEVTVLTGTIDGAVGTMPSYRLGPIPLARPVVGTTATNPGRRTGSSRAAESRGGVLERAE